MATGDLTSVSLKEAAEGLSVDDQIKLGDADLRRSVADQVVKTIVRANSATLIVPGVLAAVDESNIYFHLSSPGDRIITNQVIMALLGATTVQVGAIAIIIAPYLFPSRTDGQ